MDASCVWSALQYAASVAVFCGVDVLVLDDELLDDELLDELDVSPEGTVQPAAMSQLARACLVAASVVDRYVCCAEAQAALVVVVAPPAAVRVKPATPMVTAAVSTPSRRATREDASAARIFNVPPFVGPEWRRLARFGWSVADR